jgi:hypothetical protein
MSTVGPEITNILSEAENQLRRAISDAAARGDYSGVDTARQIAVEIREIKERLGIGSPIPSSMSKKEQATAKNRGESKSRRTARENYPQFVVEGDTLTKIGWSKKQRKEYTHKVTRPIFEQTLQAMVALATGKAGPFMAEQIIEKLNKSGGDFAPSYQVYIVIAFLKKAHCIRQEGRDGYSVFPELVAKASKAWDEARETS